MTARIVETVCAELREEKLDARKAADPAPDPVKPDEAPASVTPPEAAADNDVVVSLESARGKAGVESRVEESTKASEAAQKTAPAPQTPAIVASSMSVLDRLRARKESVGGDRQEATLTDVASAIAAAATAPQEDFAADGENEAAETPGNAAADWRAGLIRSIGVAREELKEAHAGVMRLGRAAANDTRAERRREIAERLSHAEALLDELRAARP